jgi:hypothetical protein
MLARPADADEFLAHDREFFIQTNRQGYARPAAKAKPELVVGRIKGAYQNLRGFAWLKAVVFRAISLTPCFSGVFGNGLNVRTASAVYPRAKTAKAVENARPG